ncbi:MAG: hypothetical protein EA421_01480 [Gemmatimonadales bacterium]|nr:MAG: hypothetical protein EA421_01480 [Gemmatimonadales bacterium]
MVFREGTTMNVEWGASRPRGVIMWVAAVVLWVGLPGSLVGQEEGRRSWTSDRHQLQVGDLVTVLVDESTLASANRVDVRVQNRDRDLNLSGGMDGQGVNAGARSRADLTDRTRGESARRERFATEVSTRVVEEASGGMVRVEGEKRVRIDNHEQIIALSGWIRSADVSGQNTLESWRMADAQIRYSSSGDMGRVRGIWGRLLGWLWP